MKRRRWMAIPGALVAATLTLAACVTARGVLPASPVAGGPAVAVQTGPVPLDPADPGRITIGDFRYAGGIAVSSVETSRLHGLSDLVLSPGGRITAVSDDGDLFTASLTFDSAGRLAGITDVTLRPLMGADGRTLQGKVSSDAEGLTILGDGEIMVSFERSHRIWRYPTGAGRRPVPVAMPAADMSGQGNNNGMEGLAAAPSISADGYWVGIESGSIWFCRLQIDCKDIADLPGPPAGFRLSSLTTGPGGELVVLHHSYSPATGSRIQVTIVADPKGSPTMIGRFAMSPSSTVDNFEGIAVEQRPNGDWRLYLLSDDNFSANQRTLLIAFDWTPPR
jgi:hypothetical protein